MRGCGGREWGYGWQVIRKILVFRHGLERPIIVRILDHLDGFRMIRLAFYIRES